METIEKRSFVMRSKKFGFAIIAIIILMAVPLVASGKSEGYLVPVTIKKADRSEIKGYIIFHEDEIKRMGLWVSPGRKKESRHRVLWNSQMGRKDHSNLLEFHQIRFREGGTEVFISYQRGKEPIDGNNFFSPKGIHFTTSSSNPHVLPQYLHPGNIRWIERTGRPAKIQ